MKDKDLNDFVELCRFYGERFDLVQGPGGNISIKDNDGWMYIKSSGYTMSSVTEHDNFTIIDNESLKIDVWNNKFESFDCYCLSTEKRPSMETYMHSFLDKYIVHLHPIQVNSILVRKDARKVCKELFPEALFLDYVTPGVKLAKKLRKEWKNQNLILLANHGIIVTSESLSEVKKIVKQTLKTCEKYLDTSFVRYENVNKISSIIMSLTGERCVTYLSEFISNKSFVLEESMFPDKVIFCGGKYLRCERLSKEVFQDFIGYYGYSPKVIGHNGYMYTVGKSIGQCRDAEAILLANTRLVKLDDEKPIRHLTLAQEKELTNMESEKYRSSLKS